MREADIRIVSKEAGETTAAIVPITFWREITSERETAYLLQSDAMRERLMAALERKGSVPLDETAAKLGL